MLSRIGELSKCSCCKNEMAKYAVIAIAINIAITAFIASIAFYSGGYITVASYLLGGGVGILLVFGGIPLSVKLIRDLKNHLEKKKRDAELKRRENIKQKLEERRNNRSITSFNTAPKQFWEDSPSIPLKMECLF